MYPKSAQSALSAQHDLPGQSLLKMAGDAAFKTYQN
jgi:hypothetical protein